MSKNSSRFKTHQEKNTFNNMQTGMNEIGNLFDDDEENADEQSSFDDPNDISHKRNDTNKDQGVRRRQRRKTRVKGRARKRERERYRTRKGEPSVLV